MPIPDTEPRWCVVATRQAVAPADGLRLAFELAAEGRSDREIAKVLSEHGFRTSGTRGSNLLSKDSVRVILRNRFYLGELPDGQGGRIPGKHGAMVDPELFERAQAARTTNTKPQWTKSAARSPWALSGIATCGRCGKPVVADGRGRVTCGGRSQGNGCAEPGYPARIVEEQIAAYLSGFAVPQEKRERFVTAWRRAQSQRVDVVAQRRGLERQRDRLKELYLAGDVERAEYVARKAKIAEDLAALPVDGNPDSDAGTVLAGFLADIGSAWVAATPDERNRLARQLFGQVVIANRTAVAVVPRPDLRPFFEAITPEGKSRNADPDSSGSASSRLWVSSQLTEPAEVTGVRSAP